MGFLSLGVAPAVFSVLPRDSAATLMSVLFPRYYWFGLILGCLALVGLAGASGGTASRSWLDWGALGLVVAMLGLTVYALVGLLPEVERARAQLSAARTGAASMTVSDAQAAFARLHRMSGMANAVVMVAGLLVLVLEMARRAR